MKLSPRYGSEPLISLDGEPASVLPPLDSLLRRLVRELGELTDDDWSAPSRCEGWSARDVVVHLASATSFWVVSAKQGVRGEPTRFLADFDPTATPASMVEASDESGPAALANFARACDALVGVLSDLDGDGWAATAESPPGHVSIATMAHHAVWDTWAHERDILVPMGIDVPRIEAEVVAALRYGTALGPAFLVNADPALAGTLHVAATSPASSTTAEFRVVAANGAVSVDSGGDDSPSEVLRGDAVELLEAVTLRRPLRSPIPTGCEWMFGGLAEAYK